MYVVLSCLVFHEADFGYRHKINASIQIVRMGVNGSTTSKTSFVESRAPAISTPHDSTKKSPKC